MVVNAEKLFTSTFCIHNSEKPPQYDIQGVPKNPCHGATTDCWNPNKSIGPNLPIHQNALFVLEEPSKFL